MNNLIFVVLVWGTGTYSALCPDFSLLSSGNATAELAVSQVQEMVLDAVERTQALGRALPVPTSKDVIFSKWGSGYQYFTVSVKL